MELQLSYFNPKLSVSSLNLNEIVDQWTSMRTHDVYSWWQDILHDDIVVDIGGGVGMFACQALDKGAKQVFICEPDPDKLRDITINVAGAGDRVKIVPYAIGKDTGYEKELTFDQFVKMYKIDKIDYLKINTGTKQEREILNPDNREWLRWNVRHFTAVMQYDDTAVDVENMIKWRSQFLHRWLFENKDKIHYYDSRQEEFLINDEPFRKRIFRWAGGHKPIIIYVTNW
jgi:hypothetical protein